MFHRVKPEAQKDAQAPREENAPPPVAKAAEVRQFQTSAGAQAAPPAQARPPAPPAPQNKLKQEKDTRNTIEKSEETMEDQNEEQTTQTRTLDMPAGNSYQRPGQPSSLRTPGGYPGAYPGSSYTVPQKPSEVVESRGNRTLTIGAGITMSGEIESCDYLLVEGTVEAALKGANVLDIAESGVFYGTVEIDEATIAGRFEGEITVNGRLTLRSSGVVTGSITYRELEVESGAIIDGKMTPVSAAQSEARKAPVAARSASKPMAPAAKPKTAREDQSAPANSDGELFSNKAAAAAE